MRLEKLKNIVLLISLSFVFACNVQKQVYPPMDFELNQVSTDFPVILEVDDNLNKKKPLFTLTITNKSNEPLKLENSNIYLLLMDSEENNCTHFLYNVESIELKAVNNESELNSSAFNQYMIDDNYLNYSAEEGYYIFHNDRNIPFLPKSLKNGAFRLQIVLINKKLKKAVYSNIIELELPLPVK